jgi:ribosomal protein S18 acetylase RimI-like enzyme
MLHIHQAETEADISQVRELFSEYLYWANARVEEHFDVSFDIESMLEDNMNELQIFMPPDGCLLLADYDGILAGIACMKHMRDQIGEIKRMYVQDTFRGEGIGRELLLRLLDEGREIGYTSIRLDSARFMTEAHALYRSAGFEEIDPYPESEIPGEYQRHWVFMEIALV